MSKINFKFGYFGCNLTFQVLKYPDDRCSECWGLDMDFHEKSEKYSRQVVPFLSKKRLSGVPSD